MIAERVFGRYVIALKGNQGSLYEDVRVYLEDPNHHEKINENNDKGHGRLENRTAVVSWGGVVGCLILVHICLNK